MDYSIFSVVNKKAAAVCAAHAFIFSFLWGCASGRQLEREPF